MKEFDTSRFTFVRYNNPFEDPHLLVRDKRTGVNILMDCGDISRIPLQEILKIQHLFLTHYHMDHFIGFSQLIRGLLSAPSSHTLHIYGPPGLYEKIEHIIRGFTWNLLDHRSFSIVLHEIHPDQIYVYPPTVFHAFPKEKMVPQKINRTSQALYEHSQFQVEGIFLNHKIPVLGFCLVEKSKIHFLPDQCPYPIGPWIKKAKSQIHNPESSVVLPNGQVSLIKDLLPYFSFSAPSRFLYLTDFLYDPCDKNFYTFVKNADILFIESHFLAKDQELAQKTHHLSTKDVGYLISLSSPKRWILFHFSRRYLSFSSIEIFLEEVQFWEQDNL